MKKRKLLIVTSTFPLHRDDKVSARFVYDLARALTAYYKVYLLCPHGPGARPIEVMDGVTVHRFRYALPSSLERFATGEGMLANIRTNRLLVLLLPIFLISEFISLFTIIKKEGIELVNTHWVIPQGLTAALLKRFVNITHVMSVHAAGIFTLKRYGRTGRRILRFILRNTDVVLPVSTYIKDTVREVGGLDFEHRVVSMGVDLDKFKPAPDRNKKIFIFLFVGKLIEKKGLRFLLEAVKEVSKDIRDFRLLIAGGGPLYEQMRQYADSLKIKSEEVEFLGWVNHDELADIYNKSRVLVVPSVFDSKGETEGLPTVIPEAMACGLPVIASRISGVTDIVKDGHNGWFTVPGDKDDLADKMNRAYRDKNLDRYAESCIKTASEYSWQKKAQAYRQALEAGSGPYRRRSISQEAGYQPDYSKLCQGPMYDKKMREQKAKKIIAVLKDFYQTDLSLLSCLDTGCSAGWITNYLGGAFARVIGMDIDKEAVFHGGSKAKDGKIKFAVGDSMGMIFRDSSFDVVVCSHIYEHVPDSGQLVREVYRVLKPGGVCFFAGPNRLWPIEPHYNLPGLAWLPKTIASYYLRLFRGHKYYYENLLTYWQLRRLVSAFEITDYTLKVLKDPVKYMATDMIKPNTVKAKAAVAIGKMAPWLSPTFVWILRKR